MMGLLGRKAGMTRIFMESGEAIPVSVVLVNPNLISQIKTLETDGYNAIQMTAGLKKSNRVNKPMAGHFSKAQIEPGDMVNEFRLEDVSSYQLGQPITLLDVFKEGQLVDVTSHSKGKGFAGTVKRHNFRTQDATHGNSLSHRVPGSIGQNQTPGRVFKGKKMAGHMGNKRTTVQSLKIIRIDEARNALLIKGGIPGAIGAKVIVKLAVKSKVKG